jgi:long-chain acyl-CoA synthetase
MAFNHVIVPIDRNLKSNEILNIIHESDAEVIVFSEQFEAMLCEKKSILKNLKHFISMDLPADKGEFLSMTSMINGSEVIPLSELPEINNNETAEIIFTSGSLGRAKGVMLSQKNLSANLMSMTKMLFIYPEDRFLSVLPIHHTYECTCGFLCPLFSGASIHYARSLKTVADDLKTVKATMLLAVPLLYDKMFRKIYKNINEDKIKSIAVPALLKLSSSLQKVGLKNLRKKFFRELHEKFGGSIRVFIAGGAAPDPNVSKGLREFGFNFLQGYGLTETSPILTLNTLINFKDDSAGLPLPGVELKIDNPDVEGVGEILAKGDNVMLGYYKNELMTEEAFSEEWFKTGDLGYFDKEGFLHICGRKKNVIIARNGENVYPEEIEDLLNRKNFIMESLIYGKKDDKLSEIIAAQIVVDTEAFIEYSEKNNIPITKELLNEKISLVIKDVNKELPLHKQIKEFNIREQEFEKTTTQKIKRYLVKEEKEV